MTFGVLAAGIAAWHGWRGHAPETAALGALSVALCAIGVWRPTWLDVPNRLWMRVAHALGWLNSRILLSIIFWLVITPYGALRRALGQDPLGRRWRTVQPAWKPASPRLRDVRHYDRLF